MKKGLFITLEGPDGSGKSTPVSYTHLDVYKRQILPYSNFRSKYEAFRFAAVALCLGLLCIWLLRNIV